MLLTRRRSCGRDWLQRVAFIRFRKSISSALLATLSPSPSAMRIRTSTPKFSAPMAEEPCLRRSSSAGASASLTEPSSSSSTAYSQSSTTVRISSCEMTRGPRAWLPERRRQSVKASVGEGHIRSWDRNAVTTEPLSRRRPERVKKKLGRASCLHDIPEGNQPGGEREIKIKRNAGVTPRERRSEIARDSAARRWVRWGGVEWRGVELRDCARLCETARGHAARPEIARDRAARDRAARPGAGWMGWERGGESVQCGRSVSRGARAGLGSRTAFISLCVVEPGLNILGLVIPKLSLPFLPAGVGRARGRRVCGMSERDF